MRTALVTLTLLCGLFATGSLSVFERTASAAAADPHAYFDSLTRRNDVFRAYSLRPRTGQPRQHPYYENQLLRPRDGGYAACNSCDLWITYNANGDVDPHRQDAAKVVIPAFYGTGTTLLAAGPTASDATLIVTASNNNWRGRSILVDREIMLVNSVETSTNTVGVTRGTAGTAAVAHKAGSVITINTNTVPNAVRLPLGTSDGHSYLFTWDAYWTDSYLRSGLTNHKAFNFISDGIWLEPDAAYNGGSGPAKVAGFNRSTDVAAFQIRSYNSLGGKANYRDNQTLSRGYLGPAASDNEPLSPQLASFTIKPNRWVRFWVLINQRANDYDKVSVWVADENTEPVQTHDQVPVSVRNGTIEEFVIEFNTSTDEFVRGDTRDLVSYVRNFVALQDVSSPVTLLQRPIAGEIAGAPSPPRNLRIVQ